MRAVAVRLVAAALLTLATACGNGRAAADSAADGAAAREAGPNLPTGAPVAPEPEPEPPASSTDALAGTWWLLMPDLPMLAYRVNIGAAAAPEAERDGLWVSFDWRGTREPELLVRRSSSAAITASLAGDTIMISGPSPMLTDKGVPNGHRGVWRLQLRNTSMPGEQPRWTGHAWHSELTPPDGVSATLERSFRAWEQRP